MSSSSDQKSLADIRINIDALDRQILSALEERAALAGAVVAAKGGQHVFRPGREADLIRGLIASSDLPPQMIEVIWRQIIANNITSQQRLKIARTDQDETRLVAGFCFGSATDQNVKHKPLEVIKAVASGHVDLGVLPHWEQGSTWLDQLGTSIGQDDAPVYIIAISPFIKGQDLAGQPMADGVILSRSLPDPSQSDLSLAYQDGKLIEHEGHHPDLENLVGIFQKR